MDPMADKRKKD